MQKFQNLLPVLSNGWCDGKLCKVGFKVGAKLLNVHQSPLISVQLKGISTLPSSTKELFSRQHSDNGRLKIDAGFYLKKKKLSTSIDSCCSAFTIETSFLQCKLVLYTNEAWQSPLWKLSLWKNELCAQVRRIYTKIEMLHVTHFMFS